MYIHNYIGRYVPNNNKRKYRKVIFHEIPTIISISTNVNIEE